MKLENQNKEECECRCHNSKHSSLKMKVEGCDICYELYTHKKFEPIIQDWELQYEELRKNCAGHYDLALPPEVKSFIEKVRTKALEEQRLKIEKGVNNIIWNEDGGLKSHDISDIVSSVMHYLMNLKVNK